MFLKKILASLLLIAISHSAWGLDTQEFQQVSVDSQQTAQEFLQLPSTQGKELALQQLNLYTETAYPWQVFFLSWLLQQNLSAADSTNLDNTPLYRALSTDTLANTQQIFKELQQSPASSQGLCLAQLQQPLNAALSSVKRDTLQSLQTACLYNLHDRLADDEIFAWLLRTLQLSQHPYQSSILNLFIQQSLLTQVLLKRELAFDISQLSQQQHQQLLDVLLPHSFTPQTHQAESTNQGLDAQQIGTFIKHSKNPAFQQQFLEKLQQHLQEQPPSESQQQLAALQGLLAIETLPSARLFWQLSWQNPAQTLPLAKQALAQRYYSAANNSNYPTSLHKAAREYARTQDIRFTAAYLHLVKNTEGGEWTNESVRILDALPTLTANLATDQQTQAVLKYVYLQAAGFRYYSDIAQLSKTKSLLDKAYSIPGEPLSWYQHLTGETEQRIDQESDFTGINLLYRNRQLQAMSDWIEHQRKPTQPFRDMSLDLYDLFLNNYILARPWHDPETGEALLLDEQGQLFFFNGYEVSNDTPFRAYHLSAISTTEPRNNDLTTLVSTWFQEMLYWLLDIPHPLGQQSIEEFSAERDSNATERLLFEQHSPAAATPYLSYLEYVRYANTVLLNATDIEGKVHQYQLELEDTDSAQQWLTKLRQHPPLHSQATNPWVYQDATLHSVIVREYRHADNVQYPDILLAASQPQQDFHYRLGTCLATSQPSELQQHHNAFSQQELQLYQQGYYLERLYYDEECPTQVTQTTNKKPNKTN